MRTALLFPGQGSPAAEWRDAVAERCSDLLAEARILLGGEDPFERFGEGTEFDQPAIYCATIAAFEIAGSPDGEIHAGHSLGEISALACAGAFTRSDGLRLVAQRGLLMAAASREAGAGSMLAVRATPEQLAAVVERHRLSVANLNSPSQTVLSGASDAIEQAEAELTANGVRAKRLPISGAFHSPLMASAALGLEKYLEGIEFSMPSVPVLSGRTALPFSDIRTELPASLISPVRWIDVVAALEQEGVERFLEIGPGKTLGGLVRKSARSNVEVERTPVPVSSNA